jgi:hypothetical protein
MTQKFHKGEMMPSQRHAKLVSGQKKDPAKQGPAKEYAMVVRFFMRLASRIRILFMVHELHMQLWLLKQSLYLRRRIEEGGEDGIQGQTVHKEVPSQNLFFHNRLLRVP